MGQSMSALHHSTWARQTKNKAARNPAGRLLLIEDQYARIEHLVAVKPGRKETQPRVETITNVTGIHNQSFRLFKNKREFLTCSP